MGSANRCLHKEFSIISGKYSETVNSIPHPHIDGRKLYFMFDVPHLVKNVKSGLVSGKEFILSDETVRKYSLPSNTVSMYDRRRIKAIGR
jgi:hypothetical protein